MLELVRDAGTAGDACDHELALGTHQIRRFLGMEEDEPTELTFFCQGRIFIAHATTAERHAQLLREGQSMHGFNGAYQLVNPIDPTILARYESDQIAKAWNGRATDREITRRRALFVDVDPVRPKGISSTDDQLEEAHEVASNVRDLFADRFGCAAIAHGCSGNGWFLLLALEPSEPTPDNTARVGKLLRALHRKFGTDRVKIDQAVANAARLMPSPGTWKRKGQNTPERPHRMVTFCCGGNVRRVPLEDVI